MQPADLDAADRWLAQDAILREARFQRDCHAALTRAYRLVQIARSLGEMSATLEAEARAIEQRCERLGWALPRAA
jgi:hypothetical protein